MAMSLLDLYDLLSGRFEDSGVCNVQLALELLSPCLLALRLI
jgi:hypothetical protein